MTELDWPLYNRRAHLGAWVIALVGVLATLWFWREIPWQDADAPSRILVAAIVVYLVSIPTLLWGQISRRWWLLVVVLDLVLTAMLGGYMDGGLPFLLVIVGVALAVAAWKSAQT